MRPILEKHQAVPNKTTMSRPKRLSRNQPHLRYAAVWSPSSHLVTRFCMCRRSEAAGPPLFGAAHIKSAKSWVALIQHKCSAETSIGYPEPRRHTAYLVIVEFHPTCKFHDSVEAMYSKHLVQLGFFSLSLLKFSFECLKRPFAWFCACRHKFADD